MNAGSARNSLNLSGMRNAKREMIDYEFIKAMLDPESEM
jgi:hypothetical protein